MEPPAKQQKREEEEAWIFVGAMVPAKSFDPDTDPREPFRPSVEITCDSLWTVGRRTVKIDDVSLTELRVVYFTAAQAAEHRFGEEPAGERETFIFTEEGVWANPQNNNVLTAFEWQ